MISQKNQMNSTPTKEGSGDSTSAFVLTPVRFLDSPNNKETRQSDQSKALTKSRLDVILKNLQDNYAKWQLAQKRGLQLCYSIEAIKTRCLEVKNSSESDLYPDELKPYCDKLAIITTVFEDITINTKESLRQIRALAKLPGSSEEIFYRSWNMEHFVEFLETICEKYQAEYEVKKIVMEEIAHCQQRSELVRFTSLWNYPRSVDDGVQLMFKFIAEEIKCK